MKMQTLYLVSACLFLICGSAKAAAPKECSAQLDPGLARLLNDKFPKFRIPQLSDLDKKSVTYDVKGGGNGCFAVAEADFNGDHYSDFAILLKSVDKGNAK